MTPRPRGQDIAQIYMHGIPSHSILNEIYFSRYSLAGFLINIVFSSLFLGTKIPNVKVIWNQAGPQLMYGMIIAWGQWIVALVVTGALLVGDW